MGPAYIDLAGLSVRISLSPRTIRGHVCDLVYPMPAYRVGGKLLFKWHEVERWIQGHKVAPPEVGELAEEILRKVQGEDA